MYFGPTDHADHPLGSSGKMNWVLLLLLLFLSIPEKAQLEKAVAAYWNYLAKQQKNEALELVFAESRNEFILRREPVFRSWKLVSIEPQPEQSGLPSAVVTVSIERMMEGSPGRFYDYPVQELWVFDGQSWKVKVKRLSGEAFQRIYGSAKVREQPLPATLQVLPTLLKIHFLSNTQRGSIVIRNGLETSAQVLSFDYDHEKFELVEKPTEVKPGETAKITLRYSGDEIGKDLQSEVKLLLGQGGEEKAFAIPVVYNYLSSGARGLFGLTEEQARKLKRGDKLTPAIQLPPKDKKEQTPSGP